MISYHELDSLNTKIGIIRRKWAESLDPRRFSGTYHTDPQKQKIKNTYKENMRHIHEQPTTYVFGWNEMFDEFEKLRAVITCIPCRCCDYADTQKLCRIIETSFVPQNAIDRDDTISFTIESCFGDKKSHEIRLYSKTCNATVRLRRNRPFEVFTRAEHPSTILTTKEEQDLFCEYLRKNLRNIVEVSKAHIKEQLLYDEEKLAQNMELVPPPYALTF